jgi:type I restriction enzyme R subunit
LVPPQGARRRALLVEESAKATRNNLVRQRAFSERVAELMRKYTNQQLTSAEVIAELVDLAKEVAAERNRGRQFTPPLSDDELAFYDAVSATESGDAPAFRDHRSGAAQQMEAMAPHFVAQRPPA